MRTRSFLPSVYVLCAALVAIPVFDTLVETWPLQLSQIRWRFGAVGIGLGHANTAVLGIVLAMAVAAALEQRKVLRTLSFLSLLGFVVIAAVLSVFALDMLQMRPALNANVRGAYDAASMKAFFAGVCFTVVLLVVAVAGLRATKRARNRAPRQEILEPLIPAGKESTV